MCFFVFYSCNHERTIDCTQIFEQMPNERGTMVYALQKKFQAAFGFTLPLFHGRGMLNCTFYLRYCQRFPSSDALGNVQIT